MRERGTEPFQDGPSGCFHQRCSRKDFLFPSLFVWALNSSFWNSTSSSRTNQQRGPGAGPKPPPPPPWARPGNVQADGASQERSERSERTQQRSLRARAPADPAGQLGGAMKPTVPVLAGSTFLQHLPPPSSFLNVSSVLR